MTRRKGRAYGLANEKKYWIDQFQSDQIRWLQNYDFIGPYWKNNQIRGIHITYIIYLYISNRSASSKWD